MKKLLIILIIIAVFFSFYKIISKKPANINISQDSSDLILFFGDTCPHCKDVEEFISKNQIDQKIKINQLEVYSNKSNSAIFAELAQEICPDQITQDGLPVPFLVDTKDKKCLIGTTQIEEYLTEKSK